MMRFCLVAIIVIVLTQKSEAISGAKEAIQAKFANGARSLPSYGGLTRPHGTGTRDIRREMAETQRDLLGQRSPVSIPHFAFPRDEVPSRQKDKYGRYITRGLSSQERSSVVVPNVGEESERRHDRTRDNRRDYAVYVPNLEEESRRRPDRTGDNRGAVIVSNIGEESRRRHDHTRDNPHVRGQTRIISTRINPHEEDTNRERGSDTSHLAQQKAYRERSRGSQTRYDPATGHGVQMRFPFRLSINPQAEEEEEEEEEDTQHATREDSSKRESNQPRIYHVPLPRQESQTRHSNAQERRREEHEQRREERRERHHQAQERRREKQERPLWRVYDRSDLTLDDDHMRPHHERHGNHDHHHHGHHRHHHREHYHHHHGHHGRGDRDRSERYGYYNHYGRGTMSPLRSAFEVDFQSLIRDRYNPWMYSSHLRGHPFRGGSHGRFSSSSSSSSEEEDDTLQRKCSRQTEQPSYAVTCVSPDGYEVRVYEEAVWITTIINATSYDDGGRIAFRRLFGYITGRNNQNVKMNMTKPVRNRVLRSQDNDPDGEASVSGQLLNTVSLFVPRQFWGNIPEPLDNEVFVERVSSYVYVYKFSGWAYGRRNPEMYNQLHALLQMTDQPMIDSEFSIQVLDAPWILSRRHNEMIIPVDSDHGEPTCGRPPTEGPTTQGPPTEGPTKAVTTKRLPTEGPPTDGSTKAVPTKRLPTEGPPTEGPTKAVPTKRLPTEGSPTERPTKAISTKRLPTEQPPSQESPNGIKQCVDHECPTYIELASLSDNIVIREVRGGVYATKRSTTCNMSAVMGETYLPLRKYFLGDNEEFLTIPTTVPILQLGVRPEMGPASCNFTYQTSFYIPEKYQKAPPTPNDETIFISSAEELSYYVLTFEETPTPNIAFAKYAQLMTFLRDSDLCFVPGEFLLTFYDAPWRPRPHRYEVWIPVNDTCENDNTNDLFAFTADGHFILPVMNDDPNPAVYTSD